MIAPDVEVQMYQALKMLPCGCCRKWDKESKTDDGFTVTKICGRCQAMRAYEKAYSDLQEQM